MPRKSTTSDRFWSHVDKSPDCWRWSGCIRPDGYASMRLGRGTALAHRVSWTLHFGAIPQGMCVLHRCDVRNCVRPEHLFLGTYGDNNIDCNSKGRRNQARGERAPRARLVAGQIVGIRARAAAGEDLGELAREFGVARAAIRYIVTGKSWKHVDQVGSPSGGLGSCLNSTYEWAASGMGIPSNAVGAPRTRYTFPLSAPPGVVSLMRSWSCNGVPGRKYPSSTDIELGSSIRPISDGSEKFRVEAWK